MSTIQDTQPPATAPERKTYTVKEMAAMLGVDEQTVRKLLRLGQMPGAKLGGIWLSKKTVFDNWMKDYFGEKESA